jgi:hypothetical protein
MPRSSAPTSSGRTRQRNTVLLMHALFQARLEEAVGVELQRAAQGLPVFTDAAERMSRGRATASDVADDLRAALKAYLDAARPRGGLLLDAVGQPVDREALLQAGRANARACETMPKFLTKVRSGRAVDFRLAEAALHFFREVLQRPALNLEHIGAVESHRLRATQRITETIHRVRADLPASILDGIVRRAEATAAYAWLFDSMHVSYRNLVHQVDANGVHHTRLTRVTRYQPVRLVPFPGQLRPRRLYEWYEWHRYESASLSVRVLDLQRGAHQELRLPVVKRLDEQTGVIVIEVDSSADPELLKALVVPGNGSALRLHQVEWEESMVLNAADRDIVVNTYSPLNGLEIEFDSAANPAHEMQVGDSPGLLRTPRGWKLDRTLMPLEVLAVRIRLKCMSALEATRLSPSGEWRGPAGGAAVR